ncbi:class I tRNA ligase family protein, partial [Candidatus Micrarchaeota archaeon]|nr:class I tRNA ligase family protein [Candidatus Micrarchaeota archaeon]
DFLALRDLGKLEEIKPIKIIEGEGIPAEEVVKKLGVKDQKDPLAEKATKMLYKQEAHSGKMIVKGLIGEKVMDAKETTKKKLAELGFAFQIYVLANAPVECRCGAPVGVKKVKDQWFIDYGNKEWKESAKEWIGKMHIIPEKTRKEYLNTVDWLDKKACTRAAGLGTEFPFDKGKIIEPLSDSTIYMAFYTIANKIKEFKPEELTLEFFDFVFLGKGEGNERMKELRERFLYWYPVYARHSGADLTRNHLPFFIMNHVAIFPKEQWPLGTVVNGFVLMEGKKMSKSLGNILPLRKAIKEYGADVIRFSVTGGADLSLDTNFEKSVAEGVKSRIGFLLETAEKYGKEKQGDELLEWLLSRLYRRVKRAEGLYGEMKLREVGHELFYETYSDLQWYLKRTEKPALNEFFMVWAKVFSPFIPHTCEEIWHILGNENSILRECYPKLNRGMVNERVEQAEEIVKTLRKDIETVSELVGKKPKKITIFLSAGWKYDAYNKLREQKKLDEVLKNMEEKEKTAVFLKSYVKYAHSLPEIIESEKEWEWIKKAKKFMEKEFDADVIIVEEEKSNNERAVKAKPGKPSILIE